MAIEVLVREVKQDNDNYGCGCLALIVIIIGFAWLSDDDKKSNSQDTEDDRLISTAPASINSSFNGSREWVTLKDVNGQTLEVLIHGVRNDAVIIERRDGAIFTVLLSALNEPSKLEVSKKLGNQSVQESPPKALSQFEKEWRKDFDHADKSLANNLTNWIDVEHLDGRKIRIKIVSLNETQVVIQRDDGNEFKLPLSELTEKSRSLIKSNFEKNIEIGENINFKSDRQFKYGGKVYTVSKIKRVSDSIIEITTPEGVLGMPLKAIPLEWFQKQ